MTACMRGGDKCWFIKISLMKLAPFKHTPWSTAEWKFTESQWQTSLLPEETYNQSLQVEAGGALIKYSNNSATAVRRSAVCHGVTQNEKWPKQTVLTSVGICAGLKLWLIITLLTTTVLWDGCVCLKLLFGNIKIKPSSCCLFLNCILIDFWNVSLQLLILSGVCFEFGNRLLPDADENSQLVEGPLI